MRRVLPLLTLLSLGFAPAPVPRAARPTPASADLAALQGRWDRTSHTYGRTELRASGGSIRIAGSKVAFYLGDRLRDEWSLSLNPGKDERRFDAKVLSGDWKGRTFGGTYRRDGDVLTLAYTITTSQGPLGTREEVSIVLTYKRKKP